MGDHLTTRELCAAGQISRMTLIRMMRRYPDQLVPSGRVCQAYVWPREIVAVLLSLKLRRGQGK